MFFSPVSYNQPVFRPPAEASAAILQVTLGCSWNKCAFCEMYTSKKFKIRPLKEIKPEIFQLANTFPKARKIFLADGNAMVLPTEKLTSVLVELKKQFNRVQRVSSYALPKDLVHKSVRELKELRNLGLKLLYIGIETGDDELLQWIHKGETFNSTVTGIQKAHEAGIDTSVMIINGLGGRMYSRQHALKSAEIVNFLQPKFLSTLTLSMPYGQAHFQQRFKGDYQQLSVKELFEELLLFIRYLDVNHVIYRSDHVSNNLVLKGVLGKDKEKMIAYLKNAINKTPENVYPTSSMI
ncbi:MAG: radical SAM protein [Bacteroidales bacterium]|nr:radical SAM protein [Bacteroidales bacterium]